MDNDRKNDILASSGIVNKNKQISYPNNPLAN